MTEIASPRIHRGALDAADRAAVDQLLQRAAAHDGVVALSEQFRLALDSEDALHVLSAHGYAGIVVPPAGGASAVEAVVDPDFRGNGEGALLVAAALGEARHAGGGAAPALWAHGDLPAAAGLARNLGLERVRELLQLRRAVPPGDPAAVPLPPVPERTDLTVRTYAGPSDDAELLRVNNAAFSWHPEQGGWAQQQLDDRMSSDWFDPAGLFLAFDAERPDRLLGFHWTKIAAAEGDLGEVYVVGVDPEEQGRGLGSLLTLVGLHHLADRGVAEVELYVEGDNIAALTTYRRLGFRSYAIDVVYR